MESLNHECWKYFKTWRLAILMSNLSCVIWGTFKLALFHEPLDFLDLDDLARANRTWFKRILKSQVSKQRQVSTVDWALNQYWLDQAPLEVSFFLAAVKTFDANIENIGNSVLIMKISNSTEIS